ncbi:leptin-like [Lampris incognitus]|uniref:leptin-like n=1 Tax=Lampris incognitus TaxID=2546036 RepID=UPI0024B62F88|nr:leptin-like [Lampris incognitus]
MDKTKALLLFLFSLLQLVAVGRAAPLSREAVRSKVKRNAEQLLRKIEMYSQLQFPSGPTINSPPDSVDGLSSIVVVLEGYDSLLSENLDGLPQLKLEVSSLRGYLNDWRQGLCGDLRPKPSLQGRLAELQSRKQYVYTVSIEALMGLKDFLGQLLKNLDLLGTC